MKHLILLTKGQVRGYRPGEDGRAITLYHVGVGESCILTASCILNTQTFPAIAEIEQDAEGSPDETNATVAQDRTSVAAIYFLATFSANV